PAGLSAPAPWAMAKAEQSTARDSPVVSVFFMIFSLLKSWGVGCQVSGIRYQVSGIRCRDDGGGFRFGGQRQEFLQHQDAIAVAVEAGEAPPLEPGGCRLLL